jgi:hypothetical protein
LARRFEGRDDVFLVLDQASELAAGEDQLEIGVPAELPPVLGAVECFEPDTPFWSLSRSANCIYLLSSRCWDRKYAWYCSNAFTIRAISSESRSTSMLPFSPGGDEILTQE